jgi:hypothetical protein
MDVIYGFIIIGALISLYFLPWIIAGLNEHSKTASIGIINFFFGWTFVGWVIALAWSVSEDKKLERQ